MAESLEDNKNIFEQIEKKYAPEVKNILEAVKTAYDLPWTTVEDDDHEKVKEVARSKNPYVREVVNVILGATDKDKNSILNTYISDKLADLTTWITTNESRKGTPETKSIIHSFGPNLVKEAVTNTVRNTLSNDKTMASLAEKMGGFEGRKVSRYFENQGRLPAYAKLAIRQYVPEGLEKYKDPKTEEIKTRRTYEPITDKNVKEWFSDKDKETLKDILRERDLEKPIPDTGRELGELNLSDFFRLRGDKKNQTHFDFNARQMLDHALGKIEYGHYDEGGNWREGVPNLEGNYTVKDRYDWGRDQASGLGQVLSLIKAGFTKPSYIDRNLLEAPLQMTGPLTKRKEGRDIEFTVPTYKNDPMALMNVMSSRLGPYTDSDNKTVTPLGQGDLPGFGWQEDAFYTDDIDSAPSETEDPGYYDEDIDLRGGGQISQGLDNLYMNKRNEPKEKLYHMMGFQDRQYGGGLDDAYMTLSDRKRRSAFADPNATSAFANGGLPTVYRENGGFMDDVDAQAYADVYGGPADAGAFSGMGEESPEGYYEGMAIAEEARLGSPTDKPAATGEDYDLFTGGWSVAPVDKQGNISGDKSANLAVLGPQGEVQTYLGGPDLEPGTFRDPTLWDRLTGKKTDKRGQIFEKFKYDRLPSTYTLGEAKKMLEGDIPKYLWPLWNELKFNAQLTNDQAVNYIASILATPGGGAMLAGDVKYGNWMDTAKYFIEDVYNKEGGLGSVIREQRERQDADRLYNEGLEKYGHERAKLTEEDTSILGLGKVADTIKGVASRAMGGEKPDERSIDAITEAAKADGGVFIPTSELETWIGRGIDLVNPFSILQKGLSALTGQSVIGSLEKNGLTFTVMSDGSLVPQDLSLEMSYDEGNEETIKRTPVKKAAPKAAPAKKESKKDTSKVKARATSLRNKHIEDIKAYISYTGKSVDESKKDLNITDISITEEDFT